MSNTFGRLFKNGIGAASVGLLVAGIGPALAQTPASQQTPRQSFPISFIPFGDMRGPMLKTADHAGPVVRTFINGRSYWMLIDTGSDYSLLKRSAGDEVKLPITYTTDASTTESAARITDADNRIPIVKIPLFGLGPVYLPNIPFVVARDLLLSPTIGDDPSFAGVLGENFLHLFAVHFDFAHKTIVLFKQGNTTEAERANSGFDAKTIVLPLHLSPKDEREYFVDVTVGGKPVSLLVDTGSSSTSIYKPMADFGIKAADTKDSISSSANGKILERSAAVTITLGKSPPVKTTINFGDGKSIDGDVVLDYGDGILGSDFLSQYDVLIDFPAKMMYLRPRSAK